MARIAPATPRGRTARQRAIGRNVSALPPIADLVDNILSTIGEASPDEVRDGLTWYDRAHNVAADLGRGPARNVWQAAGVLAALSPQSSWHANIGYATDAYANGAESVGHYDDATRKAGAILNGADPHDVLGGRKVRSFYANISEPERPGRVTVDRHAVAIALWGPQSRHHWKLPPVSPKLLKRIGTYQLIAAAYRGAARQLDILPHQAQAIAWATWRRLTGADVLDTAKQF